MRLMWAWKSMPLVCVYDHYQPWAGADPGVSPIHSCLPVWVLLLLHTIHRTIRALGDLNFSKGVVISEISHQVLGAPGTISHVLKARCDGGASPPTKTSYCCKTSEVPQT